MSVVSIFRDVAFEFVSEAVGPLENGGLAGHPERAPQSGIAILRDATLTAEHAGLDCGKIPLGRLPRNRLSRCPAGHVYMPERGAMHAAELQELPMMPNPTQVADFMDAYNFARSLKTLNGLTPYEYVCKIRTSEPDRFIVDQIQQMPGLNS
jgi:hypothetical protein